MDKRSRRNGLFQYYSGWRIAKLQADAPAAGQAPPMPAAQAFIYKP
jgi:hypothetical protein